LPRQSSTESIWVASGIGKESSKRRAFTSANNASAEIHLNQLHADCHSRTRCPLHGEVPSDRILSGYEYTKGQFIIIDPEELDLLRTEADLPPNHVPDVMRVGLTATGVCAGQRSVAELDRTQAAANSAGV
jgi:hypothetical protein